jgi:hypothetical protein
MTRSTATVSAPKTGTFAGGVYLAAGRPVASTSGHWAVAAAATLGDAAMLLIDAEGSLPGLPPAASLRRVFSEAHAAQDPRVNEGLWVARTVVTIDASTPIDETIAKPARDAQRVAVLAAEEAVASCSAKLEQALATRKQSRMHYYGITPAREALREAREALREAQKTDSGHFAALKVADAHFDLRIVRAALRALGARSGTLAAAGAYDAGVLTTPGGIGLVMPFRV